MALAAAAAKRANVSFKAISVSLFDVRRQHTTFKAIIV